MRRHYPDPTGDDCGLGADECTNENHFIDDIPRCGGANGVHDA